MFGRRGGMVAGACVAMAAWWAGGASSAWAQSDTCVGAALIGPGMYSGTTAGAGSDGSVTCAGAAATPDVWYRFTASEACVLQIDTCGSGYDTALSIHSGCPGTPANQLACNDDACGLHSVISYAVQAGQTCFIRVSGWNGASGPYVLNVACVPPGPQDTCATAAEIGPGVYGGNTAGASSDGASACGLSASTPDQWYRVVPPTACIVHAETCGTVWDTVLSMHSGCPGTTDNELTCNDDACAYQSVVQAFAAGGQPVYIRVSGYNGASGAYTLRVAFHELDAADACAGAIEVTDGTYYGSILGATPDGASSCGIPGARDVWYRYQSPANCTLLVSTCGSPQHLSVHSGCPGTPANQLACAEDGCPGGGGGGGGASLSLPVTIGQTVYIRVSGPDGPPGGEGFVLGVRCASVGADIGLAELSQMQQFGRLGDVIGAAVHTPVCNLGTQPLDWYVNPDPRHPFQTFNLYRLRAGRLEQIGMSWVKHGFGAAQDSGCAVACVPHPNNTRLGVGCMDTYGAGLNAQQNLLGPRHEVNAWTGAFNYATSILSDPNPPPFTPISRRLQVRDADLTPSPAGADEFIAEVFVFSHDDANRMNSVVHEPVIVTGQPGGTWNFNLGAAATRTGPAIYAWPGAVRTTMYMPDATDGRCIIAAKVSDNGDGTWRYEYAVYNHDLDRAIRSFAVPLRPGIAVSGIGFHAVRSHDEPFTNTPWTPARTGGAITWSTGSPLSPSGSNPLRWGTMYNFWFDADAPPVESAATLGMHRPGPIGRLTGATPAPAAACAVDFDLDGAVTSGDIVAFIGVWLAGVSSGVLDADFNADGAVNSADLTAFLTAWLASIPGC